MYKLYLHSLEGKNLKYVSEEQMIYDIFQRNDENKITKTMKYRYHGISYTITNQKNKKVCTMKSLDLRTT